MDPNKIPTFPHSHTAGYNITHTAKPAKPPSDRNQVAMACGVGTFSRPEPLVQTAQGEARQKKSNEGCLPVGQELPFQWFFLHRNPYLLKRPWSLETFECGDGRNETVLAILTNSAQSALLPCKFPFDHQGIITHCLQKTNHLQSRIKLSVLLCQTIAM